MNKDAHYLVSLLSKLPDGQWQTHLRNVLSSQELKALPNNPQRCTVQFALNQAQRRLQSSVTLGKMTFGVQDLISALAGMDESAILEYFVLENDEYFGTCYVDDERLIGCEFVAQSGAQSRPGLWIGNKRIS